MIAIRVFDPAMCCSTGICGPSLDPELVRFAADLDWLKSQGVSVERFNLSQEPAAFANDAEVKGALEARGEAGLPVIKVNGEVKSSGTYPTRGELAAWAGLTEKASARSSGAESSPATQQNTSSCCGPAKTNTGDQNNASSGGCGPSATRGVTTSEKSGCC